MYIHAHTHTNCVVGVGVGVYGCVGVCFVYITIQYMHLLLCVYI